MEQQFWEERWQEGRLGFHQSKVHPMLRAHMSSLVQPTDRILVPLCGKSLDLLHLARLATGPGGMVIGVEFIGQAIYDFFSENDLAYEKVGSGHFVSENMELFARDFLTAIDPGGDIAPMDFVYDRAALVALPEAMRRPYADNISALTKPGGRVFLVTFEYDQSRVAGPPFSISPGMIAELYSKKFEIEELERNTTRPKNPRFVKGGVEEVSEVGYILRRKS